MSSRPPSFTTFQVAVDNLLAFLRIKGGQGPNQLSLEVKPTIDVSDFYGMQSTFTSQEAGAAGVIGAGKLATAAVNPRRYLAMSGHITIGAAAGTYLTIAIGYAHNVALANFVVLNSMTVVPVAGGVYMIGAVFDRILPAGSFPVLFVNGNAAGADHVPAVQYSFQRLDGLP
jgi:hypothetical protein